MGERNTILIKVELLPSKIWKANVIERQPLVTVNLLLFVWFSVFFYILFVCFKLTLYYSLNESNSFKFYVVYLVILVHKLSETVAGHEIAPNTVANATKIIVLATKIQKLVAKLATRILWVLYILPWCFWQLNEALK